MGYSGKKRVGTWIGYLFSGLGGCPTVAVVLILFYANAVEAFCFEEAGRMYGINPDVLRAIAAVESGMNPDAININNTGTVDYGLMQINSRWRLQMSETLWANLAEPCVNVKIGAWILALAFRRYGVSWETVGYYNSPNSERGRRYARKVRNAYREITGWPRRLPANPP